jgi:hypothetical protein
MKLTIALCAAIALSACQTTSLQEYAEAANTLDPGCAKKVHAQVQPVLIFGWPVPIVSGSYEKECKGSESGISEEVRAAIRESVAQALEEFTAPEE